jgi:mRNA interferase HigB
MRVIKPQTIQSYWRMHAGARASLQEWLARTTAAEWAHFADLRETFPSADLVNVASDKPAIVFNISGNRYRLITAVHFNKKCVYVLLFMTHAEYSKDEWKGML